MSDATTIVIFGASGDLTDRKLIPSLFSLYLKNRLPASFRIVGSASSVRSDEEFRATLREGLAQFSTAQFTEDKWVSFASCIFYRPGDVTDPTSFDHLARSLGDLEQGPANRLYLSGRATAILCYACGRAWQRRDGHGDGRLAAGRDREAFWQRSRVGPGP